MKALLLQTVLSLLLVTVTYGQTPKYIIDKLRTIDLLTTSREDLRVTLAEFLLSSEDERSESFSSGGLDVEISYTSGTCNSESKEDFDFWTSPIGRTLLIEVSIDESVTAKELGFKPSTFGREPRYEGSTSSFLYFDKELGIAFETVTDEDVEFVERLTFFPRRAKRNSLCETNKLAKKFYEETKTWFDPKGLKPPPTIISCHVASVVDLKLSVSELSASANRTVGVVSVVSNPNDDPLTYKFIVSAGSIRGSGSNVIRDLTGVAPGTYTITAAVDDGCGFCGRTETRSIVVR